MMSDTSLISLWAVLLLRILTQMNLTDRMIPLDFKSVHSKKICFALIVQMVPRETNTPLTV